MRVKLGRRVHFCERVTHTPGSNLLLLTINKNVYTVDMKNEQNALNCQQTLLVQGYFDFEEFDYHN